MADIDENARLLGELTADVRSLKVSVEKLENVVEELTRQLSKGKGMFAGAILIASTFSAGAAHIAEKLFR